MKWPGLLSIYPLSHSSIFLPNTQPLIPHRHRAQRRRSLLSSTTVFSSDRPRFSLIRKSVRLPRARHHLLPRWSSSAQTLASITLLFKLCHRRRRIWSNRRPYYFSVVVARLCRRVAYAPLSSAVASRCEGERRGWRLWEEAREDSCQCCYLCCCLCRALPSYYH
ncbi:uncharacterized protein DS421_1g16860 [Arachis hypogaea]|nr:uncharacterized protein DS421_1g16860 [Arachis hypogaea]